MELIIIRHGETVDNKIGVCQGQTHGALTPLGFQQANQVKDRLKETSFDAIFTSDLHRAVETCDTIFSNHHEAKIYKDKRLRERFLAHLQGKKIGDDLDFCYEVEGVETIEEMFVRVGDFLTEIKQKYGDKERRVGIVSHGITIKVLTAICQGYSSIEEIEIAQNCSIKTFII